MIMGSITDHAAPFRSSYGQAKMAALQLLPVRIDGCREGQMAVAVGRLSFQGCPSLWGVGLRRLLRPGGPGSYMRPVPPKWIRCAPLAPDRNRT